MRFTLWTLLLAGSVACAQNPKDIIARSVAANNADWKAIPGFVHEETDTETKLGSDGSVKSKANKTFDVLMIDGSEYNYLLARNGRPLSAEERAAEDEKLKAEVERRKHESEKDRAARIGKYRHERERDHLLMTQLTEAFDFKLLGEETVNGFPCYVLEATPRPGYTPPNGEAKVLTGMQGKLWVDKQAYHWVRVQAEVVKPVSTYFVANVKPGTKFEFDQMPVNGIWLPHHFSQSVNARVFGVYGMHSQEEENYSNYRPASRVAEMIQAHR